MIKVKWLNSELPLTLQAVGALMSNHQYSEDTGEGFILTISTESKLSGRYIEKLVQKSIIVDPFGNESENFVVSYYTCKFEWIKGSNLLQILNPPRSIRKFISKLYELVGLGLVVSDININPLDWLKELEKETESLLVKHISSYGIKTKTNGLARVAVSGKKDIRDDFDDILKCKMYKIDCVKFISNYPNQPEITGELTNTASSKIKAPNQSFVLEKLRCSLEVLNPNYR